MDPAHVCAVALCRLTSLSLPFSFFYLDVHVPCLLAALALYNVLSLQIQFWLPKLLGNVRKTGLCQLVTERGWSAQTDEVSAPGRCAHIFAGV